MKGLSTLTLKANEWLTAGILVSLDLIQVLKELANEVGTLVGQKFNFALCNLYRTGEDLIGFHSGS